GEKKASLFHHAALLVVPSRQEAMSIVALEGAASGIPVVLTKQCGFSELSDCGGGLEVNAEAGEIASAIGGLLEQPDRCRQMGERGRALAMEKYTWRKAAHYHLALFRKLLQERR
ncbi:MAG: glycosyltransferase, partial [Bacteroidetes bacterium]